MLSVNCRVEMLSVVFRVTTKGKTKKYIERNKGVKMIQKNQLQMKAVMEELEKGKMWHSK